MIIKSLEIENIRSYKKEIIEFEEGINFLSGDIGCGKSSILQALEFGFLGFKRGDLEGVHLLRKGENEASVKISLISGNELIEIFRKIKKSKSGTITQENGFIKIGSNILEYSPAELNSKIFEILNFPKEFLTKDKNLIYRFTIYTPQEQLKDILFSESEKRLEIIRKIFAIDKYKQLKDAISIYMGKIREDKKFYEAKIEGKENLSTDFKKIGEEIINIKKEILIVEEEKKPVKEKLNKYKLALEQREEILDKIQDKNLIVEKNLSKIEQVEFQSKKLKEEKEEKEDFILKFEKESISFSKKLNDLENEIKSNNEKILIISKNKDILINEEEKINILNEKILEFNFKIKSIKSIIENNKNIYQEIFHLKNCPTCKQSVTEEHKKDLENNENKIEEKNNDELKELNFKLEQFEKEKNKILKDGISLKIKEKNLYEEEKLLLNLISQQKLEIEKIKNNILSKTKILEDINIIKEKIKNNEEIILKKKDLEEKNILLKEKENKIKIDYKKIQKIIEEILKEEKLLDNNLMIFKIRLENYEKDLLEKKLELENYEKVKLDFSNLIQTENFLSKKVVNIADIIETYVFTKYYTQFNEEFEKFFKELIEDNEIDVRLSSEFTPIIEQNGYDIDITNLSGGEKSSLAISYRFGLKKIIEENLESSQKLSLLILDEPTDGFSINQVDRLGEILKNLNIKQIILVSHDNRIDTISDKILHIEKENHISFLN